MRFRSYLKEKLYWFSIKKNTITSITVEDLILKSKSTESGWGSLYYGNVLTLANLIGANEIIEVGVAYGGHALSILENSLQIKYIGIDSYQFGYDPKDFFCADVEELLGIRGQPAMDILYSGVLNQLEKYKSRAELVRIDSLAYAANLRDHSKELVFIDDNHTFDFVFKELITWWPKIKVGGILCGDDYWMSDVQQAVNSFVKLNKLELRFVSKNDYKTWFIHKI